ncbi:hypothetical protein BW731_07060 [Vagococcus martis]|uniref:HNH nuclease domain-containing protein n=1 Tax=Vagococcus martis TaxID=1768210 RepID=A0A1V4DHF7_9ENTE|nr:HNH endonuclease [Vagococcus martis]OPF87945.1 hypothetical protein BW731_07060 [Vagococcus martis]
MKNIIHFNELSTAALIPGCIYQGGNKGNVGDDPITRLLGVGNSGGMRPKINWDKEIAYIVLLSNPANFHEYPDNLDISNNVLTYYGDQRVANKHYSETKHKGNINVKGLFEQVHSGNLIKTFPCFYFEKIGGKGRNYRYVGIAYPFVKNKKLEEVCKNIKIQSGNGVIDNYKFLFTIDSTTIVTREWLNSLIIGIENSQKYAPKSWINFLESNGRNSNNDIRNEFFFEDYVEEAASIYTTGTIERKINSRVGQDVVRNAILKKFRSCQLCEINYPELLIASHIIPWKDSDTKEIITKFGDNIRGDINNILLLCANHDKLFDKHLISFNDDGSVLISSKIKEEHYASLGIHKSMQIKMSDKQKEFMKIHRKSLL